MSETFAGKYINDKDVSLPTMDDYYYNSLTPFTDISTINKDNQFYIENPPGGEDVIGLNEDGTIFTIWAGTGENSAFCLNNNAVITGEFDGDTVTVDVDKCDVGSTEQNKQYLNSLSGHSKIQEFVKTIDNRLVNHTIDALTLRLLFIDTAEIPHSTLELIKTSEVKKALFSEISSQNSNYVYTTVKSEIELNGAQYNPNSENYGIPYKDSDVLYFYGKYQVWKISDYNSDYAYYLVLNKDDSKPELIKDALIARDKLYEVIKKAKDSRICVSANVLNRTQKTYLDPYPTRYTKPTLTEKYTQLLNEFGNALFNDNWYRYAGYNMYGQELYGRCLAVVYLKIEIDGTDRWVNLNKYVLYHTQDSTVANAPVHDDSVSEKYYSNYATEIFKPWTYDIKNLNYIDNFWTQAETKWKQDEYRLEVQKKAFEKAGYRLNSLDHLYNWTVSIGDVTFFVPPTAIRSITQTMTERKPLLRAKGSMAKNIEKSDSAIELKLFFNKEAGINGQEVELPLWRNFDEESQANKESEEKAVYYLNGLRALISEFKFTPFLPIVNKYINETLGVAAVSLENLAIETVPGFPRLLSATLTLKEFDYGVYMPELPYPFVRDYVDEFGNTQERMVNPYSLCINYDVFRYYYQKPLIKGEKIAAKLLDSTNESYNFNSVDFFKDTTFSGKTALMPCQFLDPSINIYIANEDHLKRLLSIKKDAVNKTKSGALDNFVPNTIQENLIRDLASIYYEIDLEDIVSRYRKRQNIVLNAVKEAVEEKSGEFYLDLREAGLKEYKISFSSFSISQDIKTIKEIQLNYILTPLYEEIAAACSGLENIDGDKLIISVYKDISTFDVVIEPNIQYVLQRSDIQDLIEQSLTNTVNKQDVIENRDKADDILYDNKIRISLADIDVYDYIAMSLEGSNRNKEISISSAVKEELDYNFISWCGDNAYEFLDPNGEAAELKESIDWENERSLKFDLYCENVRVDHFRSMMKNNFSRVSLLASDGYAPQYMGSQDTHISWTITTKDADMAAALKGLPEYEAYCMRNYHLVLPSFPVRIESEFTKMLGVYEVSIEEVNVSTVPNFPGLYQINIRAISTDRTLRNREALKSIDNLTEDANGDSGIIGDVGVTSKDRHNELKIHTSNEMNNKMALAEIYPDLELPKIGELGKLGFRFIRYRDKERQSEDLYVDPDFYFFYPHVIKSEILKKTIESLYGDKATEDEKKPNIALTDLTNARVQLDWKGTPDMESANDVVAKQIQEKARNISAESQVLTDIKSLELAKYYPAAYIGDGGTWNICPKITGAFMERAFLDLFRYAENVTEEVNQAKKEKLEELKNFYEDKLYGTQQAVNNIYKDLKENKISSQKYDYLSNTIKREPYINGNLFEKFLESIQSSNLESLYIRTLKETNWYKTGSWSDYQDMLEAIVAANIGTYEYNANINSTAWKGYMAKYHGIYKENGQDLAADENTDIKKMYYVSAFNIRRYTYSELLEFLDPTSDEYQEFVTYNQELLLKEPMKMHTFVLDPYYRLHVDEVDEYLENCRQNGTFAATAFMRNAFWWLLRLYKNNIFPNISLDIMGRYTANSAEAQQRAKKLIEEVYGESTSVDSNLLQNLKDFYENSGVSLDMGKFFVAFTMCLYDLPPHKNEIYNMIAARNYDKLNQKIVSLCSEITKVKDNINNKDAIFRKYLMALVGYDIMDGVSYIGKTTAITPASKLLTEHNTKIDLEAATDPSKYIYHSFYDMLRRDYRGRMLRAFPTFYCVFMDEGREIGLWKLFDNFYSINAINDISIVKSRKIAADTCNIVLSNNYSTFTTDDEDGYINFKGVTWGDLFASDKEVADKSLKKRLAATKVNRAKLQPGIRIHVRQGYGSDARELGGVFNGVIAEVQPGNQAINIIAQGNGTELMNPIMDTNHKADEIQDQDQPGDVINSRASSGASPKTILSSFFTTKGLDSADAYLSGKYDKDNQYLFNAPEEGSDVFYEDWAAGINNVFMKMANSNPYGIRNFGNVDFNVTFPEGEVVQNIYEITRLPNFDEKKLDLYTDKDALGEIPYISFEVQGKTVWDVMHICKSVAPDYMTGIVDFGFRSSVFLGKPHWYYAYDYIKLNDTYVEKRKPYQQYHVYFSDTDIISNNIIASATNVKTVATGLYQEENGVMDSNCSVGPLWADKNIYPEYQKSILVDTRLYMRSKSPLKSHKKSDPENKFPYLLEYAYNLIKNIGLDIINFPIEILVETIGNYGYEAITQDRKKIAWAVTAGALKDSIKEMYQGEIVVIGDPSVKPNDRIFINDVINDITGQVLVRDVVHNLNASTGFTTTISVDTIAVVDDRDEFYKQSVFSQIVGHVASVSLLYLPVAKMYYKGATVIKNLTNVADSEVKTMAMKYLKDGGQTVGEYIKKYGNAIEGYLNKGKGWTAATAKWTFRSGKLYAKANMTAVKLIAKGLKAAGPQILITVGVEAIFSSIEHWLYWKIKEHRNIQVFPLKKNGMVYTAGLEGSIGSVYGSVTYKEQSAMDKIVSYLAPDASDSSVVSFFKSFFLSEDIQNEAAKRSRNYKYYNSDGDNVVGDIVQIESVALGVMEDPAFHRHDTAYGLSLLSRAIIRNKTQEEYRNQKNALSRYYVEILEQLLKNENKKNHIIISNYIPIKGYLSSKFLELIHNNVMDDSDENYMSVTTTIGRKEIVINALKRTETVNNVSREVLDVPFLAKDALIVLREICSAAKNSIILENEKDAANSRKDLNGTKIILTSALSINSPYMASGAGHAFSIYGTGQLEDTLKSIIEKMYQDIENRLNKNSAENAAKKLPCFRIISYSNSKEIRIEIAPKTPLGE